MGQRAEKKTTGKREKEEAVARRRCLRRNSGIEPDSSRRRCFHRDLGTKMRDENSENSGGRAIKVLFKQTGWWVEHGRWRPGRCCRRARVKAWPPPNATKQHQSERPVRHMAESWMMTSPNERAMMMAAAATAAFCGSFLLLTAPPHERSFVPKLRRAAVNPMVSAEGTRENEEFRTVVLGDLHLDPRNMAAHLSARRHLNAALTSKLPKAAESPLQEHSDQRAVLFRDDLKEQVWTAEKRVVSLGDLGLSKAVPGTPSPAETSIFAGTTPCFALASDYLNGFKAPFRAVTGWLVGLSPSDYEVHARGNEWREASSSPEFDRSLMRSLHPLHRGLCLRQPRP